MLAGRRGGGHGAKILIAIHFLYTILDKKFANDYSVGAPTLRSQLCIKRHLLTLDSVGAPTLPSLHSGIHWRCTATASELRCCNGHNCTLTLLYTRGLGIVVSHVMVALPYRFSLWFFTQVWLFNHILKFSFKWVKVMLPYTGGEGCL